MIIKFGECIKNIDDYNYKYSLYAKNMPIKLEDEMLLEEALYDIKDKINEFNYVIGVEEVKSILRNLDSQNATNDDLNLCVDAINYYIEYDAFIDLENNSSQ